MNRVTRKVGKICFPVTVLIAIIFNSFCVSASWEGENYQTLQEQQEEIYTLANDSVKISYSAYVQTKGWLNAQANGERAGTTGFGLRMEALKVKVSNIQNFSGDILYRSHIQTYGWEKEWRKNGELSGTTGKAKRLEAVQMKLTEGLEEHYDIYYRVHVQTFGWLDWAKNGDTAGSTNYSKRIEAIQIMLVDKDEEFRGEKQYACITPEHGISYAAHVQTFGWQGAQTNGLTAGTSGLSKRMEAIRINLQNCPYQGNVEYQSHVQTYGWEQEWKSEGQVSGVVGQSKRLEAIRIRLTGELAEKCDLYYRVHCQHYGWLGWVKNGEAAGTAGFSYRMEAIQILLLPKDARTFADEAGYVEKGTSLVKPQWNVSEIITNLPELLCNRSDTVEFHVESIGKEDDSVWCNYSWKNERTGETGEIGIVLLAEEEAVAWTPNYSGPYTVTMTAQDSSRRQIIRQIQIEVNHGEIHRGDAFFTAHMGLSAEAPDNSIPAFILAGEYGFDSIEADVNETKDGVFVISHDDNLLNICGVNKNISELTYEELQDYTTYYIIKGNNVKKYSQKELRIPTLAEYLEICIEYGCIPQIDLKNLNSLESVLELYGVLCGYGIQDQVIITSFDNLLLQSVRNLNPNITLTYGVESAPCVDYEWLISNRIGVSIHYSNLLSSARGEYLDQGFAVNAYTVNDKKIAGMLLEQGVNSITTNSVLWELEESMIYE